MYTNISYIQIYDKIQINVKTSYKSHSLQLGLFTWDIEIVCFNGITEHLSVFSSNVGK